MPQSNSDGFLESFYNKDVALSKTPKLQINLAEHCSIKSEGD